MAYLLILFAPGEKLNEAGNGRADDEPCHGGQHHLELEAVHEAKRGGAADVLLYAAAAASSSGHHLLPVVTHKPGRDDRHQQRRRQVDATPSLPAVAGGRCCCSSPSFAARRSSSSLPLVRLRHGRQVQLWFPVVVAADGRRWSDSGFASGGGFL
uniref:Uncharacterized protein n=1 Tax=Leersia perrieri TaxID=77586 RepID=A0A0D9WB35_9ORYZ